MLTLLKPKNRSILGIDISSSAVKILEISGTGGSLCVESYRKESLPATAFEGTAIKDVVAVSDCIKKLCTGTRYNAKQVALAVPDSSVIFKTVPINDGLTDDEMEELVVMEADKFIPYPIDEINLDFAVQGPSAKNSAMLDVLIVASKAEHVSSRVEAVVQNGLDVKVVDVDSFTVERAVFQIAQDLPEGGKDKIIAVIDIGTNYTNLFVLDNLHTIFVREEKFGGMQLLQSVSEQYNMTSEQAQEAMDQSTLPEDYEATVLVPFKESVLMQIKRTLQFFYSSSNHGSVDHILLAGGVARQNGLLNLIKEELGVTTTIANPFSHMAIGKMVNLEMLNEDAPSLLVA